MGRIIAMVVATTVALTGVALGAPTAGAATGPSPRPAVVRVHVAYGDGPVRLAPRQGADLSFRARRGDRVTLAVTMAGAPLGPCRGRTTVVDARGARTTRLNHVLRVRAAGRVTARFRGTCGAPSSPARVRVQLKKVRLHRVQVDGPASRVKAPRRGFLDVAFVRVPRDGRVSLLTRDRAGRVVGEAALLVDDEVLLVDSTGVSVEDGDEPYVDSSRPLSERTVRRGQRVGVVAPRAGTVQARSAEQVPVVVDGPETVLTPQAGREHVLSFSSPAAVETYLDEALEDGWSAFDLPSRPTAGGSTEQRRILVRALPGTPETDTHGVRVREVRVAPDLVVGGPPLRLEATEPGQWFRATIPATAAGRFTLTASDDTTDGRWFARAFGTCRGDCIFTPTVTDEQLSSTAELPAGERTVVFRPVHGVRGGVTLTLSAAP